MASLFDKKERSPLSVLIYSVLLIIFQALSNNSKIMNIPAVDISYRFILILFCIYIVIKGIMLIIGTLKEQIKRTLIEKIQILFFVFLMIFMIFVTIDIIIRTVNIFI